MSPIGAAAILLLLGAPQAPAQDAAKAASPPGAPPPWVEQDWAYWAGGSGRWIADNGAYRSEAETFDAYGMEWTWGLGKKTLKGRLFAVKGGEEVGTIWELLSYWHPGEARLVVNQWGSDGTFGTGTQRRTGADATESEERFFSPEGGGFRFGHRTRRLPGEAHVQSYDVSEDGTWSERRAYVWKRVDASACAAPRNSPTDYSALSASLGAMREARYAGSMHAASPTTTSTAVITANTAGSLGEICTSSPALDMSCAVPTAPTRPRATPRPSCPMPRARTSRITAAALAPRAMRTPISRVRRAVL